jgi:hypothetical protein
VARKAVRPQDRKDFPFEKRNVFWLEFRSLDLLIASSKRQEPNGKHEGRARELLEHATFSAGGAGKSLYFISE